MQTSYPVIHPFTWMPPSGSLTPEAWYGQYTCLERGEGSWVYDTHGNAYLYTTTAVPAVGLGHWQVIRAMKEQMEKLSFASTCAQTHNLVQALAEKLISLCSRRYSKVFFANDGSGAVETAMRMVRQHFITRGESRREMFISLDGSYHGTTYGSGSVTHLGIREMFGKGLEGCLCAPTPNLYRPPAGTDSPESAAAFCLKELERIITEAGPENIAAVLVEPIQAVNGIVLMPESFFKQLRALTRQYGILVIADEVTTGLGRAGYWSLSEHYGLEPDVLAVSKGLTGGYFPMGAALISDALDSSLFGEGGILLHGSTQCGHPVGCAAALAVLDIIEQERLPDNALLRGKDLINGFRESLDDHPCVGDIRGQGLMLALEFVKDKQTKEPVDYEWGKKLTKLLHGEGILGNYFNGILLMYPPLNVSEEECDFLIHGVSRALRRMR
ncbi:aspartate aminotransferase family protein [Paenibacillus lutrae]|uniref:Aminotransferase class III-fold pyridoxal phosphate-dependent enzyme n=1 Tax=Paenibacillus lutrae TaxID=2078573 RepID=A0A7X3FG67_9BACL|nr:aminotransferase class III-fold pyridoxal phosphate-dependent enzyme [Paenibacillus lutrae]MVO98878.1 aminotransferase class III-fold pyridoxal phosphate-dependent enzyme [Paenibacillus lutrae]